MLCKRFRRKLERISKGKQRTISYSEQEMRKAQGRVGIFLSEKWVDEAIDINKVRDRIICKVLI